MTVSQDAQLNGHGRHTALLCATLLLAAGVLQGCATPKSTPQAASQLASHVDSQVVSSMPTTDAPASPPPAQAIQDARQELQGQLSIKLHAFGKEPAKGLSLGFFFAGNEGAGQLDLITLMGSQLAQVNWTPDEVWLTDDKGRHRYASMEHLSAAVLGEPLPLHALVHWMRGAPDPASPSAPGPQPQSFSQLGWTIDQSELRIKKLTASREATATQRGVFVKVYLDR